MKISLKSHNKITILEPIIVRSIKRDRVRAPLSSEIIYLPLLETFDCHHIVYIFITAKGSLSFEGPLPHNIVHTITRMCIQYQLHALGNIIYTHPRVYNIGVSRTNSRLVLAYIISAARVTVTFWLSTCLCRVYTRIVQILRLPSCTRSACVILCNSHPRGATRL